MSATNDVGEGDLSPAVFIIAAKVPEKPTNLQEVSADTTQITISWTSAADNGTPLLDHKIYWNGGSGASYALLEASVGVVNQYSTSPTESDLTDGNEYRFKIVAVNAVGDGAVSDAIAIYAATVPNAPAAPAMVSQSDVSITIQWTDNALVDTGGSPVIDYKVYWDNAEGTGDFYELAATTAPAFTYTVGSVTAG